MSNDLVKIDVEDGQVKDLLTRLKAKMGDMTPVMRAIAEFMVTSIEQNFLVGGRYSVPGSWMGGPNKWKELSKVTIARRTARGYWPGDILVQRGRFAASIHRRATKFTAEAGTNVKYATTMHFGAQKGEFGEKTFVQRVKEHVRKSKTGKTSTVKAHERTVTLKLPWGDIPARPVMVLQPEDIVDISDLINGYLTQ
ncbi:MAG: phage virion morphogenesis protein [bacterium]